MTSPNPSRRPKGTGLARALTYVTVAILAAAAIVATPPVPTPPPATAIAAAIRAPLWQHRTDTLARGETVGALLQRVGLGPSVASNLLRAADALDDRRARAGMAVEVRRLESDTIPREVVFHLGVDRLLHVALTDSGWVSHEERLPWKTDTLVVDGVIHSSLYEALDRYATDLARRDRAELAWTLADIFEYRVDMSRDLQDGDRIKALILRQTAPNGSAKVGPILAASLTTGGDTVEAIRHLVDGRERYYDRDGKTLQAAFLRAPLEFRRISSVFGTRHHPILGVTRAHKGTDYAAASGTPVRSIGDGVVVFAGKKSGYGNVLDVRHPNGYVSRYGHLRGFARAIHRGTRVSIGQTIAFVGMTGLATGPHLHFEVLVNGQQRNPRVALRAKSGEPLDRGQRAAFANQRSALLATMERIEARRSLSSRGVSME